MLKEFFITGTDTGIGKTVVSAALTLAMQAVYWKMIQTGEEADLDAVQLLTGLPPAYFVPPAYSFKAPLAPLHAAQREQCVIDLKRCQKPQTSTPLIVEGVGGIYQPLNDTESMLELILALNMPVILVSRGTLGTLNHTLLAIKVMRMHQIPIQGVVFSGELNPDNQATIETWGKVKTLFHLPLLSDMTPHRFQQWVHANQSLLLENLS